MSGKPNLLQIDELRTEARAIADLSSEKTRQEQIIAKAQAKIEEIDLEYRRHYIELHRLLNAMDLVYSGNNGWEARVTWFLSQLVRE